ncbi:calcium-binding protein [Geminocystis sp. GBBB08]|uniref:beta strand repeat-containing protein n=1 Tax=Geminocystis sp. GBBB08 TaxID=2604140 RepID=UPI0027E2A47D|nr:calcium-binding protein [Geminocystis sp. GBBB08]MBL1208558.1 calcium-binding protein [Geminocystis sp. GBBB08]
MVTFTGTNSNDTLPSLTEDNTGDDIFQPLLGVDQVYGGDGDDILIIDYSSNTFAGNSSYSQGLNTNSFTDDGSGSFSGYHTAYKNTNGDYDQVYFENIERFNITATNFNDYIMVGWNNDIVNAGAGNDTIEAVEGIDSIDGGAGIDIINYTNLADATNNLTINNSGATITTSNDTVIKNVEQFKNLYTGSGNDNIAFTGRYNNDGIATGDGNDTINPGLGIDNVYGGNGTDTLIINYSSNAFAGNTYPAGINSAINFNVNGTYNGWVNAYYDSSGNYDQVYFYDIDKLIITGTAKKDYFDRGGGTITIDGGAGIDTINILDLGLETVNLTITDTGATITQANGTVVKNVEQFKNLYTYSGNDNIAFTGRYNNDRIDTGNGNDTINPGLGIDNVYGGFGTDTLIIDYSTNAYGGNANYPAGIKTNSFYHEGGGSWSGNLYAYYSSGNVDQVSFSGIELFNIKGTSGGDMLYGGSGNDTLIGNNGNDLIESGAGNDILDGGSGTDSLKGGKGNDTYVNPTGDAITELVAEGIDIVESNATFTLNTTALANVENLTLTGTTAINGTGNAQKNYILGNSANNILSGLGGNDILDGGDGNDSLDGSTGNDILDGGIGNDTLVGGTGNDTYIVDATGDVVTETLTTATEIDTVQSSITYTLSANVENLILTGTTAINGTGNALSNLIIGNSGANTLSGGDGNDTLDGGGGGGKDTLVGGVGNDIYIVDSIKDVVTETSTIATEIDTIQSSVTYKLEANLENLVLTGITLINGIGNGLNNNLTGNTANNNLNGGDGNDSLDGGGGNDTLIGGTGNDIYIVDSTTDVVIEISSTATEIDNVLSSVTYTLVGNVENLTLTGTTAIINGTGNTLNNVITGNSGNNTLNGAAGNDTLDGGVGADTLIGGTGNDLYIVDNTGDIIQETSTTATEIDSVLSSVTYTLGANLENLTLTGLTAINGTGNTQNNLITGSAGNNILTGGAGNDTLIGGNGNDLYIVDNTGDIIQETSTTATEIDSVLSSVTYSLGANLENLTLTGLTAINGTGNTQNNLITGNANNNILTGGAGNDTLIGGNGGDKLVGGEGNDILNLGLGDAVTDTVIYNPSDGSDTVNEFSLGSDKFAVVGLLYIDVKVSGASTEFRLGNGTQGDAGFGTGSLLFTITGINTFNTGNIASSVDASNTANFFFS